MGFWEQPSQASTPWSHSSAGHDESTREGFPGPALKEQFVREKKKIPLIPNPDVWTTDNGQRDGRPQKEEGDHRLQTSRNEESWGGGEPEGQG